MTKKEIVKQIADELRIPQADAKLVVHQLFKTIIETLVKEGRIELRNFGVFMVKQRQPRNARNPRTNQPVQVEAKKVVTFQPGKIMEERVRAAEVVVESKRKTSKPSPKPKVKPKSKSAPKIKAQAAPKPSKPKLVPVGAPEPVPQTSSIPEPDTLPFPTMENSGTPDLMEPREYMPVDDLPNKPR